MSASKPRLLDMALWVAASGNGPKCRHKWPAVFVNRNGVQPDVDMVAEFCVMKTEGDKGEISRERSEAQSRGDAIRPNRIPYGHTFNGADVMKSASLHQGVVIVQGLPITSTRSLRLLTDRRWDAV